MNKKLLVLISFVLIISFIFVFLKIKKPEKNVLVTTTTKPFFDKEISAKSFLIGDIKNNKVIYSSNENLLVPIASISKLVSSLVVLDNMDMSQYIKVTREHQKGLESLKFYLHETVSVKDVLKMGLIMSSNDAFFMLARNYGYDSFIYKMNMKVGVIGMGNSSFVEPTGLSCENKSTALDLFKLAGYIYNNYPLIGEITRKKSYSFVSLEKVGHTAISTDHLLGDIPEIWAGKTGFTDEAGECLIVIYEIEKGEEKFPFVTVVLNSDNRFEDTEKMYNWLKENLNKIIN